MLVEWRLPIIDRWLIRQRAARRIGAVCEVWIDRGGIAYRQTGLDGHIDWAAITGIKEDDRSLIVRQGGIALMAIPKRAFASPEHAAQFVADIRRASDIPGR